MPTACPADTRVTEEGCGEKRDSLFTEKQMMLYSEHKELCVAVWEARAEEMGEAAQSPCLRWDGSHV